MKKEEKSLVKLDPSIIEQFDSGEEMMLVKGGVSIVSIWEKICDSINFGDCKCVNEGNCGNCGNCKC